MNISDKLFRVWGADADLTQDSPKQSQNITSYKLSLDSLDLRKSPPSPEASEEALLSSKPETSHSVGAAKEPELKPIDKTEKDDEPSQSPVKASGRALRQKPSIASLASSYNNNWLNWTSLLAPPVTLGSVASHSGRSSSGPIGEDLENEKKQIDLTQVNEKPGRDNTSNTIDPTQNGSEAIDQLSVNESHSSKRGRTWSFWKSSEEMNDNKEVEPHTSETNKILEFIPNTQSGELSDAQSVADARTGGDTRDSGQEDAVMYKTHDSAKEFRKINTHKNENIVQNIIVPEWELCLCIQNHETGAPDALPNGPVNSSSFDLKGWFNCLSRFSLRFAGKDEEPIPSMPDSIESTANSSADLKTEKHKLYGRSLTRVPISRRACITNTSQTARDVYHSLKRLRTQLEEEGDDENTISASKECNGNLLINSDSLVVKPSVSALEKSRSQIGVPIRVKQVLVIGVHGFFPNKMIRPLIGNPTGTSSKFANEAEKAIIRYCVDNDMMSENDARDMSIRKIALEKEGKIFDRIAFFLDILTKWEVELNEADCIFIAAHSQGCVVSIILLAHLIKEGILKNPQQKKLGILAMAGVNNGPFYGVDKSLFMKAYSTFEHDSMLELFELTKFESTHSVAYKDALRTVIAMNCKICFIGSIDDQLVPLYSALAQHVYHPNIYRACYIDQSAKAPDFIIKLLLLCLQLQNLGYFDNGVIKELSAVLAGSITSGGHSKIYNDGKVYDLGIKFLLDTSDIVRPVADEKGHFDENIDGYENRIYVKEYKVAKLSTNPFILPWCLRGLLFNVEKNWRLNGYTGEQPEVVSKSGAEEVRKLYDLYDSWRPDSKIYKELKFRLHGIRTSKL